MKYSPHNKKGFALIEVLIAIVLLSIGLLAVAGMQTTAISGNRVSRDSTTAVQLAEEIVDRIRANGGTGPGIYNGIDTSVANNCNGFSEPAKGDCIQWKSRLLATRLPDIGGTVAVTEDDPIENTAIVRVTVTWGGGRSVDFTTILETWGS